MISASRTKQNFLYVTFNGYPAISSRDEPGKHMQAQVRIKEAGYDFEPYGLTDIVGRETYSTSEFDPDQTRIVGHEWIHCDPATLTGMALALSRDDLAEALAEGFTVWQAAEATYKLEIAMYREAASSRRGRPPMTDGQRSAFVGANVTPDLKEWADRQPEGVSSLVNRLLTEEREKVRAIIA